MSAKIQIGDTIRLYHKVENTFRQTYGDEALKPRKVIGQDFVDGKRRLHLDGPPNSVWAMHARIVERA